jgi:hypothetical protein
LKWVGITTLLSDLTSDQKEDPTIQHAIQVRAAYAIHNYHVLFKLYSSAPLYSKYLMELFVEKARIQGLLILIKRYLLYISVEGCSYRNVQIEFAAIELGYTSSDALLEFLAQHGISDYSGQDPSVLQGDLVQDQVEECMAKFQKVDIKGQLS